MIYCVHFMFLLSELPRQYIFKVIADYLWKYWLSHSAPNNIMTYSIGVLVRVCSPVCVHHGWATRAPRRVVDGGGGGAGDFFFGPMCTHTLASELCGARDGEPRSVNATRRDRMTCCWLETINIRSVKYAKAQSNTSGITHCWIFSRMRTCVPVMCTPAYSLLSYHHLWTFHGTKYVLLQHVH